jgi:hypothetical protein
MRADVAGIDRDENALEGHIDSHFFRRTRRGGD